MNAVFNSNDEAIEFTEMSEIPVEQLPTLMRQLSVLAVPISLTWGAGNRPITLSGRLNNVMLKANWLNLYQSSQHQAHIALSLLTEMFVGSRSTDGDLTLIGRAQKGQRCLSISCAGHTSLERVCWQKIIRASCYSKDCCYSC